MPTLRLYFPRDLLGVSKEKPGYFVGFREKNSLVVVTVIDRDEFEKLHIQDFSAESGLDILATINTELEGVLEFYYSKKTSYPAVVSAPSHSTSVTFVLFDAPNFSNLEYFSIKPILLQTSSELNDNPYTERMAYHGKRQLSDTELSLHTSLDRINNLLNIRDAFYSHEKFSKLTYPYYNLLNITLNFIKRISIVVSMKKVLFSLFIYSSMYIQYVIHFLLSILNYEVYKFPSLKNSFAIFRQLDLRLQQFNYFPVQFLNYYDPSKLAHAEKLKLKENTKLNINNSNYINLHNSLWLIVNDILLGLVARRMILNNISMIETFLNDLLIQKLLYSYLQDITLWLMDYPAGLKLNKELAEFIGVLFLWTLKCWKMIIGHFQDSSLVSSVIHNTSLLGFLGLSFLICIVIDFLNLITSHIYAFYYTSSRIYKRQLSILKSLFQLFRGKKYNVLRDRIDYSVFEIDQLLLGTLLFTVLVYLLPTVGAFYLSFVVTRLAILIVSRVLESSLTFLNIFPLFVLLLKLKNSNRLQGGINLDLIGYRKDISYLKLSNKSLSYSEIFGNFFRLFQHFKIFKVKIFFVILHGDVVMLNQDYSLTFPYLMLPANFMDTKELWDLIDDTHKKNI